jgi:hypothetical protein
MINNEADYAIQNINTGVGIITCATLAGGYINFNIDPALFNRPGRYVLVKANTITNTYTGASVAFAGPSSLNVRAVGVETVKFGSTNHQCVVVTLA